jgi:predicted DNA-binding transcriptional regulator AlpA
MSSQSIENLIDKKQLSEKLSLSISYINKLMAKGLPTAPTAGRAVRFRLSEVFAWLERNSYK